MTDTNNGAPTPAGALHPEGGAARGAREAGPPRALSRWARPRRPHVWAGLRRAHLPWPRPGNAQAPPPGRSKAASCIRLMKR